MRGWEVWASGDVEDKGLAFSREKGLGWRRTFALDHDGLGSGDGRADDHGAGALGGDTRARGHRAETEAGSHPVTGQRDIGGERAADTWSGWTGEKGLRDWASRVARGGRSSPTGVGFARPDDSPEGRHRHRLCVRRRMCRRRVSVVARRGLLFALFSFSRQKRADRPRPVRPFKRKMSTNFTA